MQRGDLSAKRRLFDSNAESVAETSPDSPVHEAKYRRLPAIFSSTPMPAPSTWMSPPSVPATVATSPRKPSTADLKAEIQHGSPIKMQRRPSVVFAGLAIDGQNAPSLAPEPKPSDEETSPMQRFEPNDSEFTLVTQNASMVPPQPAPTPADSPRRPSTAAIKEAILHADANVSRRRFSSVIQGLSLDPASQHAFRNMRNAHILRSSKGFQTFYSRELNDSDSDLKVDVHKDSDVQFYQLSQADIAQARKKFVYKLEGLSIFQSLRVCGKDGKLYGDRFDTIRHGQIAKDQDPELIKPGAYAFAIVSNKTEVLNLEGDQPNLIFRMKPLGQGAHKGLINLEIDKPEAVGEVYIDESHKICFLSTKTGHFHQMLIGVDQLKVLRKFFDKTYLADENFYAFKDDKEYFEIQKQRNLLRFHQELKPIAGAHSADDVRTVAIDDSYNESEQKIGMGVGKN